MIYTFYSYKGGVGRSMALANVAELLFRQGKRVVMIDWDLEAPGLEGYFCETEEKCDHIRSQPGLIDILDSYRNSYSKLSFSTGTIKQEHSIQDMINELLEKIISVFGDKDVVINEKVIPELLTNYNLFKDEDLPIIKEELLVLNRENQINRASVYSLFNQFLSTDLNKKEKLQLAQYDKYLTPFLTLLHPIHPPAKDLEKGPGLWLLSAGWRNGERFAKYSEVVQSFDWTDFYQSFNGELYFEWMRKELDSFADFILIDSRTGVTEMGGVCTRQLADVVVLVTAPNAQNLTGVAKMIKSFTRAEILEARGKDRSLKVVVVPSRIDNNESLLRNQLEAKFYRTIDEVLGNKLSRKFWELRIPYIPYYNYNEELAIGLSNNPEELEVSSKSRDLDMAYRKLTAYLKEEEYSGDQFPEEKPLPPYVGIKSYQVEDAPVFFGRSHEISRMLEIISQKNFVIISGPPGSGKTSTINAGLIPLLKANKSSIELVDPIVILFRPRANPLVNLAEAIARELEDLSQGNDIREMSEELGKRFYNDPKSFSDNIKEIFKATKRLILILDQFEEVFTQISNATELDKFIDALSYWVETKQAAIIISIRTEYCDRLISYPYFSSEGRRMIVNLEPLSERDLRQIMVEPATRANLKFEQGLVERILKDIENVDGKLPVLQALLYELWYNRQGNRLTHGAYDKLGRTDGILIQMFESTFKRFSTEDLETVRPVLTRLVNVQTLTRQSLVLSDSENDLGILLKPFIDAGLLIVHFDEKTKIRTVELAHDSLVKSWPRLNEWIAEDKSFLLWRQQLNVKLDNWVLSGHSDNFLLNQSDFTEFSKWLTEHPGYLTENEINFIKKSSTLRAKQNKKKLALSLIAILTITLLVIFIPQLLSTIESELPKNILVTDSLAQKKAKDFSNAYTLSNQQFDLKFNLEMIKQYYTLDKKFQDSLLAIKKLMEIAIEYKFQDLVDSFYYSIREKPTDIHTYLTDTVLAFGHLNNISKESIQNKIINYSKFNKITNKPLDTTIILTSNPLGFRATYVESGNVLLDKLKEYNSVKNFDTILFDNDLKIKSFAYTTFDSIAKKLTVEVFVCNTAEKSGFKIGNTIVNALRSTNKYNLFTRGNFSSSSDPSSPYHVTSNQIRYNGDNENNVARSIQETIKASTGILFNLVYSRTATPNYISIFVCDGNAGNIKK